MNIWSKRVTYQSQTHISTLPTCWIINLVSITILSTSFIYTLVSFSTLIRMCLLPSRQRRDLENDLALSMQIGKISHVKKFLATAELICGEIFTYFLLNARWLANDRSIYLFFLPPNNSLSLRDFSLNPFAKIKSWNVCAIGAATWCCFKMQLCTHKSTWCEMKITKKYNK